MQEHRNAAAREAALAVVLPPPPDSLQTVAYMSAGKTLIIGSPDLALKCADQLCGVLPVTVLLTEPAADAAQAAPRSYSALQCSDIQVSGWLGAFDAAWRDPGRGVLRREGRFDLVLDLSPVPLIGAHQKPHGYFAPGASDAEIATAVADLAQMIGEFEKPKYFKYKERLCAHSRNRQTGCTACIDICSAKAIASAVLSDTFLTEDALADTDAARYLRAAVKHCGAGQADDNLRKHCAATVASIAGQLEP